MLQTPWHACGVAFSPGPREVLAVANYEFISGSRRGGLLLYGVEDSALRFLGESEDLDGVYDVAWLDERRCVCGTATGYDI